MGLCNPRLWGMTSSVSVELEVGPRQSSAGLSQCWARGKESSLCSPEPDATEPVSASLELETGQASRISAFHAIHPIPSRIQQWNQKSRVQTEVGFNPSSYLPNLKQPPHASVYSSDGALSQARP